jgi:dynein heavy chain
LNQKLDNFIETMPLLEAWSDPAVQKPHWKQIIALTGVEFDTDQAFFRFSHEFNAGLLDFKDDVQDICNTAQQEAKILTKLKKTEAD